ncbi:hypothetical protein LR007_04275, partial [candidate division NPL-UPA2 bacterium]|nr:hypothetical protein [candidate division NPL-UPA2 bacterium]
MKKSLLKRTYGYHSSLANMSLSIPSLRKKIPEGAEVVILMEDDPEFNQRARNLAEKSRQEGQQVIIVKVKGLAPVSASRLINPE